jgi:GT2 family glycosyltransferase
MLVERRVFRELRGFDPTIFAYYEDMDICKRLRRRDLSCHYVVDTEITHVRNAAFGQTRMRQVHSAQLGEILYARAHWPRLMVGLYLGGKLLSQMIRAVRAIILASEAMRSESKWWTAALTGRRTDLARLSWPCQSSRVQELMSSRVQLPNSSTPQLFNS